MVLIIRRLGLAETWGGNAIALNTPIMDSLVEIPVYQLVASGEPGLPLASLDSEVGHLWIRPACEPGLTAINESIKNKYSFLMIF